MMRLPKTPDRGSGHGRLRDDAGVAFVLVLIWSTALLLLSLVVVQAALNQIQPSDRTEDTYAALSAAEAGIDDYRARLAQDPRYFLRTDTENPALSGWADVPGGDGSTQFTITVDRGRALVAGQLRVISTGRSGNVTRTVESVLTKRSTLDYVYVSDYETMAPAWPGAYADNTLAGKLCTERRWKDAGWVSNTAQNIHRNSSYCRWAGIYSGERLFGRVHTNDVWYLNSGIPNVDPLNAGGSSTAVFNGAITSSCPPAPNSSVAGCPDNHRWINTDSVYSNTAGTWSSSTAFRLNEIESGNTNKAWNPKYDTVLEIPASNSRMKELAEESGCVFTGPTRIRLYPNGTMAVTSPDTRKTRSYCGGTSLLASTSTPATQPTITLNLGDMVRDGFNGVIYVQGTRTMPTSDPNYWATSSSAPTCLKKTGTATNSYPFVIPSAAERTELFRSSYSGQKGFPSAAYGGPAAWYDCNSGDLFIQGEFKAEMTIAAENNIALTGFLVDTEVVNKTNTSVPTTYGMPPVTSNNMIGLVPNQFLYAYRPLDANDNETADWNYDKTKNVIYNFAALVLNQCFGAQSATEGVNMGQIFMRGSLGQKYRCPVGLSGGGAAYSKQYTYDQRFMVADPPPYMLEMSNEPWKVQSQEATNVRRDVPATEGLISDTGTQARSTTRQWDVLLNDGPGLDLAFARMASGGGTAGVAGGKVTFTAPDTPMTSVIEVVVRKQDGTLAAQYLTITVT